MTHLIAIDRVKALMADPKAMSAYRTSRQRDKHRLAAEATERHRRRIAGHGG